ncbi:hypothetical protein [Streptomyces sp. DSM 40750]|uniref:hypothetical protein n=1 Tax=Streptomyces sp. DSM 40750 TaxID=2801030 RepID=UPI00214BFAB6|nr:hypothetical protein [Streptomyces sp. DSM 40750]UUU19049.1 hypothetical protein JIX55_01130 [Streptomyces sp. DSM 40750]UUU27607.1 hypothetical protein JIX55_49620 [Streptomyces sp. DSM 40750]
MASVLGMLEERETAARVRVEGLREEVARLAGVLEAAEIELDRRVIAREELVEALAASAADTTAVTEAEAETVPAPVPGSIVPPWREGLPVTVLATDGHSPRAVPTGPVRGTGGGHGLPGGSAGDRRRRSITCWNWSWRPPPKSGRRRRSR